MRDFLVRSLNTIIWMFFALIVVATIIGAGIAFAQNPALGVVTLVTGLILAVFVAGTCFLATGLYELAIGIYNSTTRTAAALEALAGIEEEQN